MFITLLFWKKESKLDYYFFLSWRNQFPSIFLDMIIFDRKQTQFWCHKPGNYANKITQSWINWLLFLIILQFRLEIRLLDWTSPEMWCRLKKVSQISCCSRSTGFIFKKCQGLLKKCQECTVQCLGKSLFSYCVSRPTR